MTHPTKLLVSVQSLDEARIAVTSGCDILDIKNPREGSLGANFPGVLKSILDSFPDMTCETSATVGDLDHKPGTGALAAYAVASLGIDYVKAGLIGSNTVYLATEMLTELQKAVTLANPRARFVASSFADWRKFDGLSPLDLIQAAKASGVSYVLIDTFRKDGSDLFDNMTIKELQQFVKSCHDSDMQCALAGSIKLHHLPQIKALVPDYIGVRGALCSDAKTRHSDICPSKTAAFVAAMKNL